MSYFKGYTWLAGSRHKVDPEIAGRVCEELERDGGLTAERLVDVSRPEDAPLHKEFEWDDSKAAELYRHSQGRTLIRHLVTVEVDEKGREYQERVIFHVESENAYMTKEAIVRNPDALESLKQQALREMISFKTKYKRVKELQPVFNAMDEVASKEKRQSNAETLGHAEAQDR